MPKIETGLSFDDVLILPGSSDVRSRYGNQLDLSTQVARGMPEINLPLISSNMETVTEAAMAQEMALYGGLGIVHRFMTPEAQAKEVELVKQRMRVIEENPLFLPQNATIRDALLLLEQHERGYVIVTVGPELNGRFAGIATTRDFLAGEPDAPLSTVMTPNITDRMVTVPKGTSLNNT